MEKEILFGSTKVTYTLERKKVKNINLRVKKDGSVHVSAHPRVPLQVIEDFLRAKAAFIFKARSYYKTLSELAPPPMEYKEGDRLYILGEPCSLSLRTGKKNSVEKTADRLILTVRDTADTAMKERTLIKWKRELCRSTVTALCEKIYPLFSPPLSSFPTLRFRQMRSRWGSCQPKTGILTFNYALAEVPLSCVEYVVMHEFTHFLHPDHSPRFYAALSALMPDYKARRRLLRTGKETCCPLNRK